jgi:hypothetical protein
LGGDAAQALQAGAAQQAVEDGFRLVVGGVAGRDPADAELPGRVGEPGVADLAGVGFEVSALFRRLGAYIAAGAGTVKVWSTRKHTAVQIDDKYLVSIASFAAQEMVEVSQDDRTGGVGCEDGARQGHAVRAAGDGDDQAALDPVKGLEATTNHVG